MNRKALLNIIRYLPLEKQLALKHRYYLENLPLELQLKIYQHLIFEDLCAFKQTNKYFLNFINKHKEKLAKKEFISITFMFDDLHLLKGQKRYKAFSSLDNSLSECKNFVNIPVFILNTSRIFRSEPLIVLEEVNKNIKVLELPVIIENINQLKIIKYWLNVFLNLKIQKIYFNDFVLNSEIIRLLFDDNIIIFNCENVKITYHYANIEVFSIFDHMIITNILQITIATYNHTLHDNNFLSNLLLTKGNKIAKVCLQQLLDCTIHHYLINILINATNLTNIIKIIEIQSSWPRSTLSILLNDSFIQNNDLNYTIINNNNPEITFLVTCQLNDKNIIIKITIKQNN